MPRLRVAVLAGLATVLSGGLCAGLAWQWVFRDALAYARCGRWLPVSTVVALRKGDGAAFGDGLLFLPVVWGWL